MKKKTKLTYPMQHEKKAEEKKMGNSFVETANHTGTARLTRENRKNIYDLEKSEVIS